ncbi:MAG: aminopeptidase P family protein, partial [Flavobacteriaceae bacterium]
MRYQSLPSTVFKKNRKEFSKEMLPNSIALLASNDIQVTNADDSMGFAQNNDLYYLSGIDQEETILLLYPDAYKAENREILFIKETNEHIKIWEGDKLTAEQAIEISGISRVEWVDDFEKILQLMAFEADGFYLGHNEHIKRVTKDMETRQDRLINWCRKKYPLHDYFRAAKITRSLRQIKTKEEVEMIKKAAKISIQGFERVLIKVEPGIKEYALEAELSYNLIKEGAQRHAFKPIVASGSNACALHYNDNDDVCKEGDMILMDFGVCYGNYNSDTTRCFPVNGKFSERQKEVYSAVLRCLKTGSELLKPGIVPKDYEEQMAKLVEAELIGLGLISKEDVDKQD